MMEKIQHSSVKCQKKEKANGQMTKMRFLCVCVCVCAHCAISNRMRQCLASGPCPFRVYVPIYYTRIYSVDIKKEEDMDGQQL
jgi:hypothetical protein